MKLKIVSDGTPYGTYIFDESGQQIKNCVKLEIEIDAQARTSKCVLTMTDVPFEFTGEGEVV